jgi:hypothetical protein
MKLTVVVFSDEYYLKSNTMISSVYLITKDGLIRTDWGRLQKLVREGNRVTLRPPTKKEIKGIDERLELIYPNK